MRFILQPLTLIAVLLLVNWAVTANAQQLQFDDESGSIDPVDWLSSDKYRSPWTAFAGTQIEFAFTRTRDLKGLDTYRYCFRNQGPNLARFTYKMPWVNGDGRVRTESGSMVIKPYSEGSSTGKFFIGQRGQELVPSITLQQLNAPGPQRPKPRPYPSASFIPSTFTKDGIKVAFKYSGMKGRRVRVVLHFQDRNGSKTYGPLGRWVTLKHDVGTLRDLLIEISSHHFGSGIHTLSYFATLELDGRNIAKSSVKNMWWGTGQQLGTIRTTSSKVTVLCRDHGAIDGDRVAIYRNGGVVASNVELQRRTSTFQISLSKGRNGISFRALNEGLQSPNTAEFSVVDSNGNYLVRRREWSVSRGQDAMIIVIRE